MAVDLPAIRQRITVDDSALEGLSRRFGSVAGTLGKAVAGGAAIAAAGVGAFAVSGARAAIDVDRGLREVNTLFGETGAAAERTFDGMKGDVAGLSDEIGVAQDVLVGGLYSAISAGVPKDNAFEFLEVASKAAIGGVTDTETAVDGITTAINAFGLDATDAESVADSMFTAVKGGKTTFEELSASMANVAPAAAAAKVPLGDVNAAIATLTAGGTPTAQATTQIRAALVGLQKPSEEMDGIFQDLGYSTAQQAIEAEGLQFALDAVAGAADGDNGKLQQLLGSTEAVSAVNVLAGTGAAKFAEELDAQANSAGASNAAFEEMEKSTGRQMEKLKTNFQNASIVVGEKLLPVLNRVVEWATTFLPVAIAKVEEWVRRGIEIFETFRETITAVVDWITERWSTIEPILIGVGIAMALAFGPAAIARLAAFAAAAVVNAAIAVTAWVSTQAAAIKSAVLHSAQVVRMIAGWVLLGAQSLLQAARVAAAWLIAMGPVGIVIAIVVALVALIIANWDTIVEWTRKAWTWVTDKIGEAWAWIKDTTTAAVDAVVGFFTRLHDRAVEIVTGLRDSVVGFFRGLRDRAIEIVVGWVTTVVTKVLELRQRMIDTVTQIRDRIVGFFGELRDRIVEAATTAATRVIRGFLRLKDGAIEKVTALVTFVREIPGKIREALGNVGEMLLDAGRKIVQGLIDGITDKLGALKDKATEMAGAVRDFLPFSPAKEGPLSGRGSPARAGAKIGSMVAAGISASAGEVASAAGRLAGAASAPLEGIDVGGSSSVTDARQYHYTARATGSPVAVDEEELIRMLHRLEMLSGAR